MAAVRSSCCLYTILLSSMCALISTTDATEPAWILGFGVTGGDGGYQTEVDLGDMVTFACTAKGDPSPLVSIWKQSYFDESYSKQAGATYGSNVITKAATCVDNGSYRCRAENTFQGQPFVIFKDLVADFRVKCPPTSCSGLDDPQTCTITLGPYGRCSVCLIAYPMFDYDDIDETLERETQSGWETSLNYEVTQESFEEPTFIMTMIIYSENATIDDFGNYRVVVSYPSGNNTRNASYVYFELTDEVPTVTAVTFQDQTTTLNSNLGQTTTLNSNLGQTTTLNSNLGQTTTPNSNLGQTTTPNSNSNSGVTPDSNSNSDQDTNSDSYISLSTQAIVDVILAGLLVLTLTIVIILCVCLCQIKNRLAKVNPLLA